MLPAQNKLKATASVCIKGGRSGKKMLWHADSQKKNHS